MIKFRRSDEFFGVFLVVVLIILIFLIPSISFGVELPKKNPVPDLYRLDSSGKNTLKNSVVSQSDFTLQLDSVRFVDLVRIVYGDILKMSYVIDKDLEDSMDNVSVNWLNFSKDQIMANMNDLAESRGFDFLDKHGSIFIKRKSLDRLQETLIYKPKFRTARYLSDFISHLSTAKPVTQRGVVNPMSQTGLNSAAQDQASPTSATALLDKADSDTIVMNVELVDYHKAYELLNQLDTPVGEIMLKAAVYEVQVSRSSGSAFQLVSSLLSPKILGLNVAPSIPSGSNSLSVGAGGFNLILSTLDNDSRFKTVSKPSVRVRSGSQAKFSVGQDVPVLGQATLDKNGNPVQSVNYMSSGDILTVTPDVHENIIDLNVSQEISSFTATTSGVNNSPTLLKRTVTSNLSIKADETIAIAGLNDSSSDGSHNRLFGYNIGHLDDESSTEIIVFLTVEKVGIK